MKDVKHRSKTHLKTSVTEWHGQVTAKLMESHIGFGEHQVLSHRFVKAHSWMFCALKKLNENKRCIERNEMMVYKLLKENQLVPPLTIYMIIMLYIYDFNIPNVI